MNPYARASLTRLSRKFMPDTAVIQRFDEVRDSGGGVIDDSTPTVSAATPCRITPAMAQTQGSEMMTGAQLATLQLWDIWFPVGTDVRDDDRIVIDSVTYEVRAVISNWSYDVGVHAIASTI